MVQLERSSMISIKENTLERISHWTNDSIYILADFDHTITSKDSITSWGILENSNIMPDEYKIERIKLLEQYRPIEIDETISFNERKTAMNDWWSKHLELFVKYHLSEETIIKEASKPNIMTLRAGAKEFLEKLNLLNIPLIIISAGIGDFLEAFLKSINCYYDNIHIISNYLDFKNGIATGVKSALIHSQNKNEISLSPEIKQYISNRSNIILLGDNTGDAYMTSDPNALKIGFLEEKITENRPYYEETFDIVCTNTSYDELLEILPILNH